MALADDIATALRTRFGGLTLDASPTTGVYHQVANGAGKVFFDVLQRTAAQAWLDGILQATGLTLLGDAAEWLTAKVAGGSMGRFRLVVADGTIWLTWNSSRDGLSQWHADDATKPAAALALTSAGAVTLYSKAAPTGDPIAFGAGTALGGGAGATPCLGFYGDGSDGALVFDGTSTVLGVVPSGNVYTITSGPIQASSLTINAGVTVRFGPAGNAGTAIVLVRGTATISGTLSVAGSAGASGASSGTAGQGGGGIGFGAGATGGQGGGASTAGFGGTSGGTYTLTGGSGGTGGSAGGFAGGTGGSDPTNAVPALHTAGVILSGGYLAIASVWNTPSGGGGGGGGGGGVGGFGGGGGGGGGNMALAAPVITGTGTITTAGGVGGPGAAPGGGGGGGHGGVLWLVRGSRTGSLTVSTAGGLGGAGAGGGANGTAGDPGLLVEIGV